MSMRLDSAVFICSHGRPDKQLTLNVLRQVGYDGVICIVVDDEDSTYDKYLELVDSRTIIHKFCKQSYIDTVDIGYSCSNAKRSAILYAKCECERFAKSLSLKSFVIADDDITGFRFRYQKDGHLMSEPVTHNMDTIIQEYYSLLHRSNIVASSFGDVRAYIGGCVHESRMPYNFVFRNGDYEFNWYAEMYEDTVSPILNNIYGRYTLQLPQIQLNMKAIDAKESGGMRDIYDSLSIYKRAFVAKIFSPTCIKISNNNVGFELNKDNAFPKLISSTVKKS